MVNERSGRPGGDGIEFFSAPGLGSTSKPEGRPSSVPIPQPDASYEAGSYYRAEIDRRAALLGELKQPEIAAIVSACSQILAKWKLSDEEKLALIKIGETERMSSFMVKGQGFQDAMEMVAGGAYLSASSLWRCEAIVAIHGALRQLFREPERAYEWIKRSNTVLQERSALYWMLCNGRPGIEQVRAYLEAEAGGYGSAEPKPEPARAAFANGMGS